MKDSTLDIEALLAFHRATFGDARMDDTDDDAGDDSSDDSSSDDADTDDASDDAEDTDSGDDDAKLGDAGKQALDRMKAKLKSERTARRAAEAKLAEKSTGDESETDEIRRDAEAKATAKANERIVRSEIKAAAAGKLADPADALVFLDLSEFEVDADGNVDEDDIAEAIDELISKKPHLAAQSGKRFAGKADGGTRKESRPAQLSDADVKRLYAERKYDEIEQAQKDGRLDSLLSGK